MSANGKLARSNPVFAAGEDRVTDALTSKLAGSPGVTLVDRASLEKIFEEQNLRYSDRSSPATVAKIGKLLGAGQIVLVQLIAASQGTHQENSGMKLKTIGAVQADTRAQIVDVETAEILAQPSSSFEDSAVLSETNLFTHQTKGSDQQVFFGREWTKATDSLTADLAQKLKEVLAKSSVPSARNALVAGVVNGSIYINQGMGAGIRSGDRFQVVRMESVGLKDPASGEELKQKTVVCSLVVLQVNENNSSGKCDGGKPVSGDVAERASP
jgi:hypothetical protein